MNYKRALTTVLGNIPFTDIYESIDLSDEAREFDTIRIIRFEASIFYGNVEYFTHMIKKLSKTNLDETLGKINKAKRECEKSLKKFGPKSLLTRVLHKNKNQPSENIEVTLNFLNKFNIKC